MRPDELIGRGYRLGADFNRHGVGDCLSLAVTVLSFYGIETPTPQRAWYRRLRRGDTSVFKDELERWGARIAEPRLGSVALCQAENGYGLAVFWEAGWLVFVGSEVVWRNTADLRVVAFFCPQKLSCAMQSG